jgi:hypothetical protein
MRAGFLASAIAVVAYAATAGCGGSTSGAQNGSPQQASDASAGDDGSAEAGANVDQDPNVFPAMHAPIAQVDNLGGPILNHPTLVSVTFTGYDAATPTAFTGFLGTSDWWHATVGTYGIADAVYGGAVVLDNPYAGTSVRDSDFQTFLAQRIASGALPVPSDQTLYVVWLPTGTTLVDPHGLSNCGNNGYAGYHNAFTTTLPAPSADGGSDAGNDAGGGVANIAYAIVADCGHGPNTVSASHEIAESVSDPLLAAMPAFYLTSNDAWLPWYQGNQYGGEIGDLCILMPNVVMKAGNFYVSRIWSNKAASASRAPCQPDDSVNYGLAIETPLVTIKGVAKSGHLVVAAGGTTTANGVFFSTAALPNDASLAVGTPTATSTLNGLPTGVTATLSRTTAHNGEAVSLTITAANNAARGESFIVVRASLGASQYRDWPILLDVK